MSCSIMKNMQNGKPDPDSQIESREAEDIPFHKHGTIRFSSVSTSVPVHVRDISDLFYRVCSRPYRSGKRKRKRKRK